MGNVRGIGNGTPMRLVSPAPVIVNAGTPGGNMRLLGSQPQQIATPPAASSIYSSNQPASLYSSSNGTTLGGIFYGNNLLLIFKQTTGVGGCKAVMACVDFVVFLL